MIKQVRRGVMISLIFYHGMRFTISNRE